MELARVFVVLFTLIASNVCDTDIEMIDKRDTSKVLSRRKRFVNFPEGASFSMAFCITVGVYGQPSKGIFTWGLNWGIAYNLPNATETINAAKKLKKFPKPFVARRFRRDAYARLELIIDDMGYKGRECIFRALCEASQRLMPRGETIVEELFRTVFTMPKTPVLPSEPIENHLYDAAHRLGNNGTDCAETYWLCPVSLLDMALGYYSHTG